MKKKGFIVRFVDVVLILLFGFISISSIRATEIDLPDRTETTPPLPAADEQVFIAIRADGTYLVQDETLLIRGAESLYRFLSKELSGTGTTPIKVRIRASHNTPMKYLVEAARVCDALDLPRSFEVLLRSAQG